ncbi:MAG: N-acetyl-gamma-glutamyl-phosphate reductase [Sphingomonadales bacterium RIFCSPHIGHO2_01_FULL_65_20]|jgi:N-acetyl-gamma-glutamyl-phosphate reductase|uniref:N-acetyl-gamma-glutamyl-phosphate reductase n=1 Tax=unclassified Blastomonas TaxID=2626550 RepID=UPI00082C226F|nr:MAG: N-acetyl-gamma-glutamyl-phosphate reductase [Sphingomonadales bacterium RIFCSPHIGHO2_01_FULL_65_20]
MLKLFIDGAAGTTGLEIAERMAGRDEFRLITLSDADRKSVSARAAAIQDADFVILCLPDAAAREAVALGEGADTRFIDASSAHRVADGWTYGFAELRKGQREAIASARLVSNPGCYPTGFLALVAPLVAEDLLPADHGFIVNAVSGYSGGGKDLIQRMQVDAPEIGFRAYALGLEHKHLPEMQVHAGLSRAPIFAPAVVRAFRGMLVDVPLFLDPELGFADARTLHAALVDHYAGEPLVSVAPIDAVPGELLVSENDPATDRLSLYVLPSADGSQVRLVAMLDNLGKGASGAAVQNLNIMAELDELAGLRS